MDEATTKQQYRQALDAAHRQRDYQACWAGLRRNFTG